MNIWAKMCILYFFMGIFIITSCVAKVDPKTVAVCWLFEEGKGNTVGDLSDNKNDGLFNGNLKWANGKFGKCLEFDGLSAYVNCKHSDSLDITKEITVMAWVNFKGLDYKNSTGRLNTIAAKGYPDALAPHAGWWFSYDNRQNRQDFPYTCFGNKNGGWAGGGNSLGGNNFVFDEGVWYHLAFTIAKSIAKLYINGTQFGADKTLANLVLSDTSRDLFVGCADRNWFFGGLIDEFAIFNVALSTQDIKNVMDNGLREAINPSAVDYSGKLASKWGNIKSNAK